MNKARLEQVKFFKVFCPNCGQPRYLGAGREKDPRIIDAVYLQNNPIRTCPKCDTVFEVDLDELT